MAKFKENDWVYVATINDRNNPTVLFGLVGGQYCSDVSIRHPASYIGYKVDGTPVKEYEEWHTDWVKQKKNYNEQKKLENQIKSEHTIDKNYLCSCEELNTSLKDHVKVKQLIAEGKVIPKIFVTPRFDFERDDKNNKFRLKLKWGNDNPNWWDKPDYFGFGAKEKDVFYTYDEAYAKATEMSNERKKYLADLEAKKPKTTRFPDGHVEYEIIDKLYPSIDEVECPHYKCKDCKHYIPANVNHPHGCTHRYDHAKIELAHPWFDSFPYERVPPCSDFEPDGSYPALMPYWHGYEHWKEWLIRQNREDDPRPQEYVEEISKNFRPSISFMIKGDKTETIYSVDKDNYIYGTMFDGNKLKAFKKKYYKRTKEGFGYKLVEEEIDGVIIK